MTRKTCDPLGRWRDAHGRYTTPPGEARRSTVLAARRMLALLPPDSPLWALTARMASGGDE